jgi:hypothetical protein
LILLFFCLKENVDTHRFSPAANVDTHRFSESPSGATPMATPDTDPDPGKKRWVSTFFGEECCQICR